MKTRASVASEWRSCNRIYLRFATRKLARKRKRAHAGARKLVMNYGSMLGGGMKLVANHSVRPCLFTFLEQLISGHPAARLAVSGHSGAPSHTSLIFLLLFPAIALCAVRVPLPEKLFDSDFRARLGSMFSEHQSIANLTVHPMRRRPGSRHVFSYKLHVEDKRTGKRYAIELIGKQDTTRAAGKAAKEFEAMRLLWGAGFGQDHRFRIPQPLHLFADLRLIIQEKARGTKLRAFLGDANDTSLHHARMTGLWLAKLHTMPVDSPQLCAYDDEKASLRMFIEALKKDQPQLESELRHCAEAVELALNSFQDVPATHVHGDFHPDHVYVAKNFVTVIDFERFCIGDPARDLGSFVAHMRSTAGCIGKAMETVNQEIMAFLESYFSGVTEQQGNSVAGRIAPYAALSSLEAIYYVASVLKVTDSARIAMYMQCLRESGIVPVEAVSPSAGTRTASA